MVARDTDGKAAKYWSISLIKTAVSITGNVPITLGCTAIVTTKVDGVDRTYLRLGEGKNGPIVVPKSTKSYLWESKNNKWVFNWDKSADLESGYGTDVNVKATYYSQNGLEANSWCVAATPS